MIGLEQPYSRAFIHVTLALSNSIKLRFPRVQPLTYDGHNMTVTVGSEFRVDAEEFCEVRAPE